MVYGFKNIMPHIFFEVLERRKNTQNLFFIDPNEIIMNPIYACQNPNSKLNITPVYACQNPIDLSEYSSQIYGINIPQDQNIQLLYRFDNDIEYFNPNFIKENK